MNRASSQVSSPRQRRGEGEYQWQQTYVLCNVGLSTAPGAETTRQAADGLRGDGMITRRPYDFRLLSRRRRKTTRQERIEY